MNILDLIRNKRDGFYLTEDEIYYIINSYMKGIIKDYQMSALLMSIYFQGLNSDETKSLTMAMAESGQIHRLSKFNYKTADIHSVGNVGGKTTLIAMPMAAALGVPVVKLSGIGVSDSGCSIEKLEGFRGFSPDISMEDLIGQVDRIQIAAARHEQDLAPADKLIYTLRNAIGVMDQYALTASSIMSRRIASGADIITLDIAAGGSTFIRTAEDAVKLAELMVSIGSMAGRTVNAVISITNQPLGYAVGNNLELIEVLQTLKGKGPRDLLETSYALAANVLMGAGAAESVQDARKKLEQTIESGKAFRKMEEYIKAQGGTTEEIHNINAFKKASIKKDVYAGKEGYITAFQTDEVGRAASILCGRQDGAKITIDHSAGILLKKKLGDFVGRTDSIATICANDPEKRKEAEQCFLEAVTISPEKVPAPPYIYGIVTQEGVTKY